mmetsp:Transcript_2153/g.4900  ORF Transcript_2153/g.4900 Transcript_2153/m.4900 type:complete len:280 (-) Transcript_2153:211-1050(-)
MFTQPVTMLLPLPDSPKIMFLIRFWTCNFSLAFNTTCSRLLFLSFFLSSFFSDFLSSFFSSFLSFLSFLSLSSFLSFLSFSSFLSLAAFIGGMNSPMISSISSMPNAFPSMSMSGSFDLVSSSFGRMQRYHNQFVKDTGDSTPLKLSLLSLQATFTALQFFPFSTVPRAAASSSSSFFETAPGGAGSSSSSSASPASAAVASPSRLSPSIAAKAASSSSSSSAPSCFRPISFARSCNHVAKFLCVCRSSAGMAPSMDDHSTCERELAPLTTIFCTMASR